MPQAIRYGFVGTGMMGCEHIANVMALDNAVAVAAYDPEPTSLLRAEQLAAGISFDTYNKLDDLLARDDLDAVVVSSPNHTHRVLLDTLLPTDLALLIEKPLCTTVEDCIAMAEAAEEREAVTWMGLEYRYMPAVAEFLRRVDQGDIGRLAMLSIREHRFPFLPKVGNWNRFTRNTGGTLVEKCCHFFDLMNLIIDGTPERVFASGAQDVNHLDEQYQGETPDILDNAFVIVDYDSGQRAMLDLCMFAEGSRWEQELSATGTAGKVVANIPGFREVARGAVSEIIVGDRGPEWPVHQEHIPADPRVTYQGAHHGASFIEHLHFCDAIRSGGSAQVTFREGLASVAVGAAAHRSIDEGRPVYLAEFDIPARLLSSPIPRDRNPHSGGASTCS